MIVLFIFILGLAVGSFLNVLIDRLPEGESIGGRSHCDFCHKSLTWYDLIPVFSFMILGGSCRYCHKKLSWQYPLIEAITGIFFVFIWQYPSLLSINGLTNYGSSSIVVEKISLLGIMACLIVIFFSDLKYHVISEAVLLTLLLFSLVTYTQRPFQLSGLLFGAVITMLPILILYILTRGRGMGFGDVELAFVMGALLGLKGGLVALYIGFIAGGLVGVVLLITHKKRLKSHIAFGPFLVVGTILLMFFESQIFNLLNHYF